LNEETIVNTEMLTTVKEHTGVEATINELPDEKKRRKSNETNQKSDSNRTLYGHIACIVYLVFRLLSRDVTGARTGVSRFVLAAGLCAKR
jgi:hypothetical protein